MMYEQFSTIRNFWFPECKILKNFLIHSFVIVLILLGLAVVAHFFARVTKLFLHPEDPVYQPVLSFLVLKPDIDLENVPEIYKLLMSSSTQFHHEERLWCLRLITHSLIEPYDYNVLQKRFV